MTMRVASVNTEFPPYCGGKGVYALHLSKSLEKMGVETIVFTRGKRYNVWENTEGIRVGRIASFPGFPVSSVYHSHALHKALEQEGPFDLIHVHGPGVPALKVSIPCVYTAHWCYRTAIPHFYRPVRSVSSFLRNIAIPIYNYSEKSSVASCRTHSAVSSSIARELKTHYGLMNVKVMNNGINPGNFKKAAQVYSRPVVLFVGKVTQGKGVTDILAAFSLVRLKVPDAELWLVGVGELAEKIRHMQKTGQARGVRLLGMLDFSEVLDVYRQARIFVLPSYYEGMPNVILEAMASGLPVIGSDVSGIPDLIADGETGYLVPVRNPKILAKRMTDLLLHPEHCIKMGNRGRERVFDKFTWDAVSRSFFHLFQESFS
ncbi:MAG: glycosyltransferase family 4 protein [Desulfobacterales bacterium]|nr:glycosyltransferase family 4 protein [Desulfobacterales bacterium]